MRTLKLVNKKPERRVKHRFGIHRELRYKLLKDGVILERGEGETIDMGSGGIAFSLDHDLAAEAYVELSISWPVLLEDTCPMRLIVFGRVLRSEAGKCACTVDKYEFRTQARTFQASPTVRNDSMLQRWAEGVRKENMKARALAAV
jgi:hypothetical protein